MARHQQRPDRSLMICTKCKADNCSDCVDIVRAKLNLTDPICQCQRKKHQEALDAAA